MMGRMSLVEQKRLQWAKEREEMAKLSGQWEVSRTVSSVHSTIRTKMSSREQNINRKPLRACGQQYGSAASLKSSETNVSTSLQSLNFTSANSGSMININNRRELPELIRKRSPSLPPIYTKEHQHNHHQTHSSQELPSLEVEGSRYTNHPRVQKHSQRETEQRNLTYNTYEEREGETSGYASDSVEIPAATSDIKNPTPLGKVHTAEMSERTWQNPYCDTPDTSLPPSRRISSTRLGELNRPRWGSIWGSENPNCDPPPPSWLERGLSRLDHSSQVLVITHDSVSSPNSSTASSTNSDSKTYLRGQNIPVDAQILHERETRRQKALELQTAIKQQLEERDRMRKEEKAKKLREEREEEERIKRECDKEKARFEEEQQRLKEKEQAKLKKEEAMREILQTAERAAKEKKRQRRQRDDYIDVNIVEEQEFLNQTFNDNRCMEMDEPASDNVHINQNVQLKTDEETIESDQRHRLNINEDNGTDISKNNDDNKEMETREELEVRDVINLPVNKEVAIVLTGQIKDSSFLDGSNLQLLNLVVNNPKPKQENESNVIESNSINALLRNLGNLGLNKNANGSSCSPRIFENRLLTPSKYRTASGRDFGTQTDGETENQNIGGREIVKGRKEHNNERDFEKSTNVSSEEKNMSRSKSQPRPKLETRPRWNANRPGTRYRTQSEKDPHYQKRLRLRRRRVESSDERSRSPSPDRRMSNAAKTKVRQALHRKSKLDSYDADMSMESLNSVMPLRIDEHGRINVGVNASVMNNGPSIENSSNSNDESMQMMESRENSNTWDGQNIISQLVSLKNGLLSKQREWDLSRCLVSPTTEFC